jgi:hypothetical protein
MLGYIEYPSHYSNGLDSPVGLTFRADVKGDLPDKRDLRSDCAWFTVLPDNMDDEEKEFLARHLDIARHDDGANLRSACTAPRAYKPSLPTSGPRRS